MGTDGPRGMPGTRFNSSSWKWWRGTESNHRHADFQYGGERGSARVSRRNATSFRGADRTALPDRAQTEPRGVRPTEPRWRGHAGHGVGRIETERGPNRDRPFETWSKSTHERDGCQVRLVDDHVSASPTTYNNSTVMIPANTIDPLPRMTV
jgi:hypothetical protein